MNPIVIAKAHCANWQTGNRCSGIAFNADGSMRRFRAAGLCQVCESRCPYFESSVLPIGEHPEWVKKYPGLARQFQEGADRYARMHSGIPDLSLSSTEMP